MKPRTLFVSGLLTIICTASAFSAQGSEEGKHRQAPPALYLKECGSCHAAYPARALGSQSWERMMGQLDKHFGSDASLDNPEDAKALRDYLKGQARRRDILNAQGEPLLRITETPWFLHEHDEIAQSVWHSDSVKSPSSCGACHQGADQGLFSEHDLKKPYKDKED